MAGTDGPFKEDGRSRPWLVLSTEQHPYSDEESVVATVTTTPHDALQKDDVIGRYELAGRQAIIYIEHMEGRSQLTFDITATQSVEAECDSSTIRSYYSPDDRAVEGPIRFHATG